MSQQTKTKWDRRNQQVATPPTEVRRKRRATDPRRQSNVQPQQQTAYSQNRQGYPSAPLRRRVPQPQPKTPGYRQGELSSRSAVLEVPYSQGNNFAYRQGEQRSRSAVLEAPYPQPPYPQGKHPNYRRRRRRYKGSLKNLLILRLVALTVIATGLAIMGFGLYTLVGGLYALIHKPIQQQPTQQATPHPTPQPTYPSFVPPPSPNWSATDSRPIPSRQPGHENIEVVYNFRTPPEFKQNQELQTIVNNVVNLAADRGFPTQSLSITLIDAKTGEIAGYQQETLKYPASVAKMFWMVFLYAQIANGVWSDEAGFYLYIARMIQESDNEAASFIVDKISDTEFEHKLDDEEFETWRKKREQVTHFFEQAGYEGINLTHKTYPIASLKLLGPQGSELRIRKNPDDPKDPFRNEITTFHSARLMYETCYLQQAISPEISKKMCGWLKRDLNPEVWKNQQQGFNPIVGFLGQSLADTGVNFYSKAGWTTGTRQEAALIATADGKTVYILAIGADDSMYAKDWQIYPKMSRFVYEQMVARQPQIQGNRE
ncbi:hypothetical protein F7734_21680 [Scytonema sp. UIC 10036]|uniref:serine hydrolase n=1 Tax=Scytonema sp. UIC 10036 TaxID=2304196 RepID=UPI0012DA9585|nr:hypothetical protein [Scytonema sp. UIC 10036]